VSSNSNAEPILTQLNRQTSQGQTRTSAAIRAGAFAHPPNAPGVVLARLSLAAFCGRSPGESYDRFEATRGWVETASRTVVPCFPAWQTDSRSAATAYGPGSTTARGGFSRHDIPV
jgi:hypothetical protein